MNGNGNIYVTGGTYSATGIAARGYQNVFGGYLDIFLLKINSNGARLWSSYHGGQDGDIALSCATDPFGNLYMAGGTYSQGGIASGGYQNFNADDADAFLIKVGDAANAVIQLTGERPMHLKVYPNPISETFIIEFNACALGGNSHPQLQLTNMTGKIVWQKEIRQDELARQKATATVPNMVPGTYILTLTAEKTVAAQKVVLLRL